MWTEQSRGRMAKIAKKTKRCRSDLTDEEWERIAPLMPGPGRRGRPREVDVREVRPSASGPTWPSVTPIATKMSENSPIWTTVGPARKRAGQEAGPLAIPHAPMIARMINGLPISTKSEKTTAGAT
jgi:hypothetical protein